MAAITAVVGSCCFVSSCKISHFGRKPVIGGRPPSERRTRGVAAVSRGALAHDVDKALMFVALLFFKVKNAAVVITKYVRRARRVREGAN